MATPNLTNSHLSLESLLWPPCPWFSNPWNAPCHFCARPSPLCLFLPGAKDWKWPDSLIANRHTFFTYAFNLPQIPNSSLNLKCPPPNVAGPHQSSVSLSPLRGCLGAELQLEFSFSTLVLQSRHLSSSHSALCLFVVFPLLFTTTPVNIEAS